jgi:hypothetical protein
MDQYLIYPKGINDFKTKFNQFIETNPNIEIISVNCSSPFINVSRKRKKKLVVSVFYC